MNTHERKLKAARRYLDSRRLSATATDSAFRYRNSAGQLMQPPDWLKESRARAEENKLEAERKTVSLRGGR